jgi:molybdate transport system substrate-binding protein
VRHAWRRTGSIHVAWLAFLASVVVFAGLVGLLAWDPDKRAAEATGPLFIHCAAGLRAPVEKVARDYEAAYRIPVQINYGPSETLVGSIGINPVGDLFLPADDSYLRPLEEKGLIAEVIPLARMTPVIAVRKGNPKKVRGVRDLLRPDVRVALAADSAAVGKMTREALQVTGQWDDLKRATAVFKTMVTEVANDVKVGTVDAGIVWDALLVKQYEADLEAVAAPELASTTANVPVAVLRNSTQPTAALRFARYLSARDRGLKAFEDAGFRVVEGDMWAEKPEINFLGGAMLRPAVEETITAFEEREGCRINRIYNGCGILVAQMKTGARPDMYFACDQSFMTEVTDLFHDAVDVSVNQLVILVHKGNPHGIKSLRDLGKPGLKVGVGHEKQCALGVITQRTLDETRLKDPVMKNVVAQFPTGDMLVNQLRVKALDAVIAYISNATGFHDEMEAMTIDIPCALAVQPIAVGKESKHKRLAGRLLAAIRSRESRERFEENGFRWQEKAVSPKR